MSTDSAKRAAAYKAVDENVTDGMLLGIGSGSTIVFVVERIAQRVKSENLSLRCIPTSFQARNLIIQHNLTLSDLNIDPLLDLAIDGADEIDGNLNCIKGGGAAHTQEKCVAFNARKFILVVDFSKDSLSLGTKWTQGIPLEVLPFAYRPVMVKVAEMHGKAVLRAAKAKAGPVVTDNGNFVVDAHFGGIQDPFQLNKALQAIPGVVETGLFCGMANKAYIGLADGSVKVRQVNGGKDVSGAV